MMAFRRPEHVRRQIESLRRIDPDLHVMAGDNGDQPAEIDDPGVTYLRPKDRRFVHTMRHWLPRLEDYRPTLLWLTRESGRVRESFRRGLPPAEADLRFELGRQICDRWPCHKHAFDYHAVQSALAIFGATRHGEEGRGHDVCSL